MSIFERFWSKVREEGECWIWTDTPQSKGYGAFNIGGHPQLAHRLSYRWLVGPIPVDLTIDHLCPRKLCINPRHLEAVPRVTNWMRGKVYNLFCFRGHSLHDAYMYDYGYRHRACRTCSTQAYGRYIKVG